MFFTRKATKPAPARSPAASAAAPKASPPSNDASTVLDALGGVLQAYACFPLETDSLDGETERPKTTDWMRHATVGAKHPARAGDAAGGVAARDWRGLVHFVGEHRRSEHQHAQKAMGDLRQTIWSLVASAHRVAQADAARPMSEQLERVQILIFAA